MPMEFAERLARVKKKVRSDLKKPEDWWVQGFYKRSLEVKTPENILRINLDEVDTAEFISRFEVAYRPVIIRGIAEHYFGYSAERDDNKWSFEALERDFGDCRFRVGDDDDGDHVKMRLWQFFKYMREQQDDSPLYIFDDDFGDNSSSKKLIDYYRVPKYFRDDLFSLVGESKRPPYRWLLVGPKRSGTSIHVDPLGTSAWNTSLCGRKRWVLFPPETPKRLMKPSNWDKEAITLFYDFLPDILRETKRFGFDSIEFIQQPGETVFIPGGWWHAVINLDDTLAVTHNFCSYTNFPEVWRSTRTGRKKMSKKWLKVLEEKRRDLADIVRWIGCEEEKDWMAEWSNGNTKKRKLD